MNDDTRFVLVPGPLLLELDVDETLELLKQRVTRRALRLLTRERDLCTPYGRGFGVVDMRDTAFEESTRAFHATMQAELKKLEEV